MTSTLRATRAVKTVATLSLVAMLAACSAGTGLSLTTSRTQGYVLTQDQLAQVRPGQSQQTVVLVLGSPQAQNSFGDETSYYYVSSKIDRTAFGLETVRERTVVAVYFDKNKRVSDKAVYGLADGRMVTIETRRTPSFGEDRGFIESILSSI
jgi:outer membrane protein assembly factor BamE (lipoprotein component of BamABCDE complex)